MLDEVNIFSRISMFEVRQTECTRAIILKQIILFSGCTTCFAKLQFVFWLLVPPIDTSEAPNMRRGLSISHILSTGEIDRKS